MEEFQSPTPAISTTIIKKQSLSKMPSKLSLHNRNSLDNESKLLQGSNGKEKNQETQRTNMNSILAKSISKLPNYIFDPSLPNPQQKQQSNKYFERLRKKIKNQRKASIIKTTELGENEKIFTKQEQRKLQIIDQFLQRGLDLPTNLYQISLQPPIQTRVLPPLDIPLEAENKQIWNEDQILENKNWADNGNRKRVQQQSQNHSSDKIKKYLEKSLDHFLSMDENGKKKKKKNQFLSLNFQMRVKENKENLRSLHETYQGSGKKGNKRKQSCVSSFVDKMKGMGSRAVSQFEATRSFVEVCQTGKKFPPIFHKDFNIKISQSLLKRANRKEQFEQLKRFLYQKYIKIPQTPYMTSERKQALFQCELLKAAKQFLSDKQYHQLQIKYENDYTQEKLHESRKVFMKEVTIQEENQNQFNAKQSKQEKMKNELKKNRLRLKTQKQRIIEKIRW